MRTTTKKAPLRSEKALETAIKARFHRLVETWGHAPIQSYFKVFDRNGATWQQRQELRKELTGRLPPSPALPSLLQPGRRPHLPGIGISISHCPIMGGFIFSIGDETGLGLDIEQDDRVPWQTIARVSQQKELSSAPRPSLLWAAKEAAVKSLPPGVIMPHIKIEQWKSLPSSQGYGFSFCHEKRQIEGEGIGFLMENLAIGCARVEK